MIVVSGIAFSVVVLGIIVMLLLRRQLREKYALLWLAVGLVVLVVAIFPGLLEGLTSAFGFVLPSNFFFAVAIVLLVGVTLHLSWELSRAEEEVRRVAEDVAILKAEVDQLRASDLDRGTDVSDQRPGPGPGSPDA